MSTRGSSRIEGFSDAVFGFALTLLVVSLEAPTTFAELQEIVRGFLPFVFTFATIAWLWYEHYDFFRRFGPDDRLTIVLNCALLFVVLFYVYPLKFLFTLVVRWALGDGRVFRGALLQPGDGVRLMTIYGLGFIAVFLIFALMYARVWARRDSLRLDPLAVFDARTGIVTHLLAVAVGVVSVAIVLVGGDRYAMVSGLTYSALGPVTATWGYVSGSRRARLERVRRLQAQLPV